MSSGIAARYAAAVFELSEDAAGGGAGIAALERDVETLSAALAACADLREMIASPILSRAEQGRAIGAVAAALGLSPVMRNALALMATKRRLFVVPQMLADLTARIAAARGEVTAEVASAVPLTEAQAAELARTLSAAVGKTVRLKTTVDGTLIGGLVVKVGSRMVDTSIRARLAALQNAMKEVR
jgi:F-type H+-transporting ATPase subunit delta